MRFPNYQTYNVVRSDNGVNAALGNPVRRLLPMYLRLKFMLDMLKNAECGRYQTVS